MPASLRLEPLAYRGVLAASSRAARRGLDSIETIARGAEAASTAQLEREERGKKRGQQQHVPEARDLGAGQAEQHALVRRVCLRAVSTAMACRVTALIVDFRWCC